MNKKKIYNQIVLSQVPFLLSQIDRETMSPTFGCCDRLYWQWKFIDYPCARFQDIVMTLSYVYSQDFDNNHYYQNNNILKWIESIFIYWSKIQNKDGSFNEAYPYERSFVATGFSLFYITEAYFLIKDIMCNATKDTVISTFIKAGRWLIQSEENHAFISNHRLGTAAGLYNLYLITGDDIFKYGSSNLWDSVKTRQSKDGWYNEYGGADIGYLTQGIYYAALLYERSNKKEILDSLNRAIEFIKYFIHPDGTLGGEYGSRNTEFYFAGGIELLSKSNEEALNISQFLINSLKQNILPNPQTVDLYNQIPLLNSIIHASLYTYNHEGMINLPFMRDTDFTMEFNDYKLLVIKSNDFYNIVGLQKNGVVKSYNIAEKTIYKSCVGIFGIKNNQVFSSQYFNEKLNMQCNEKTIVIHGPIQVVNHSLLNPTKMIGFRIYCIIMKYFSPLSGFLKKIIVKILISRKKQSKSQFKRTLTLLADGSISVNTVVSRNHDCLFSEQSRCTSYHMGSSKYFNNSDLYI